jgi:hypothetical protein
MKKTILLAGLYFTGISFVFSQNATVSDAPKMLNNLKTVCRLTSPQMQKLQPIVQHHIDALNADKQKFAGYELTKADNSENAKFDDQLKGILSSGQMKSYEDNKASMTR